MKSRMSKHWAGKGYNSPLQQLDTKLKDVPGEVIAAGKRAVDRVKNATVRDALDLVGPGLGKIIDSANPKEKREGKPYRDGNRSFSVIKPVQGVPKFPPPTSNSPSATRTPLKPKAKSVGSPKAAGLKSNIKVKEADDEMRFFPD